MYNVPQSARRGCDKLSRLYHLRCRTLLTAMMVCLGCGGGGGGAWWRRRRPVPVTVADQVVVFAPTNSIAGGQVAGPGESVSGGGAVTLVLPSTMSRSAGNSPGVIKPAGASPLVPSCRSAFSATGGGGVAPTSPYSDSATVDHQRRVTSVKQMAQLFEEASSSSWQRDVKRQLQHQQQFGVDVLAQSRQHAADRHNFTVNSQLFFFSTSSTTTTTTTTSSSIETSSIISDSHSSTSGHFRPAVQGHTTSPSLRPGVTGRPIAVLFVVVADYI